MPRIDPDAQYSVDYKRFVQDFFATCDAKLGHRGGYRTLDSLGIHPQNASRVLSGKRPSLPTPFFLAMALYADLDPTAYLVQRC